MVPLFVRVREPPDAPVIFTMLPAVIASPLPKTVKVFTFWKFALSRAVMLSDAPVVVMLVDLRVKSLALEVLSVSVPLKALLSTLTFPVVLKANEPVFVVRLMEPDAELAFTLEPTMVPAS